MKFLCLVSFAPQTLAALSPTEKAALNRNSLAYNDELGRNNHYLAAEALQPVSSARTVRVRHGKTSVTDGPFAEAKSQHEPRLSNSLQEFHWPNSAVSKCAPL
jgi:hypothetical protein